MSFSHGFYGIVFVNFSNALSGFHLRTAFSYDKKRITVASICIVHINSSIEKVHYTFYHRQLGPVAKNITKFNASVLWLGIETAVNSHPEALKFHFSQLVPVSNVYHSDTRIYHSLL